MQKRKHKPRTLGYIVTCSKLGPMRINKVGLARLYAGSGEVTIFSSKAQIKTAIDNTKAELAETRYSITIKTTYGALQVLRVTRPPQLIRKGR